MENTKHKLLIMSYKEGLELKDIPEFIDAIEAFAVKVKEDETYKDQPVKLYFLPEELANIMIEVSNSK